MKCACSDGLRHPSGCWSEAAEGRILCVDCRDDHGRAKPHKPRAPLAICRACHRLPCVCDAPLELQPTWLDRWGYMAILLSFGLAALFGVAYLIHLAVSP